jgi:uncharacterized protein YndB with AHSA1/START domain
MLDKVLKGIIAFSLIAGILFLSLGIGSGKHEIVTEIEISAPVETVFNYALDESSAKDWISGFKSIKLISGENHQPGSKYELIVEENGKEIKILETVTEFIPNKKYAFDAQNEMMTGNIELIFEPSEKGTLLTEIHRFEVKGFVSKAMTKLAKSMIKKGKIQMYENLKIQLEK